MRQLLILGYYCKVYRREPLCRVYIDDVLVDEFNIPHTHHANQELVPICWSLDPTYWSQDEFDVKSNTLFLKFIELSNTDGKFLDLKIEIQNNDNNYANGFMTKNTCIMLRQCWLAPIKVWEEFDQIRDRWKFSRHNWNRYFKGTRSIAHYYTGTRNIALYNLARYADRNFADINQQLQSIGQKKLPYSNHQVYQHNRFNPSDHWQGSSGYFHLTLAKKLGFWRPSMYRRRGWWKFSAISDVKGLYDKYKNYEDKRSTDQ